MSNESAEQLRGRRQSLPLSRLYLDPNNYRFHDHPEYCTVSEEHIFDADVQRRTIGFVRGRNQDNVQDLIACIKANGWLDIDPILVERKDKGRFLVIEGNRRVATLKFLQGRYDEGAVDLGRLDRAIFSGISVNLYTDTHERDRLVMMGLHHISGKRRWPTINRAQAMKQLLPHFNNDANKVCQALGVSKREFNLSVRTLALVDVYKESDYGDQFESSKFNLFREVLASTPIRDWLGWDNKQLAATKQSNLDRLFSWVSKEAGSEEEDGDEDIHFRSRSEPVMTTGGHLRELAKIIEDPVALNRLDKTRSLQEATLSSNLLVKSEIDNAFNSCEKGIQKLYGKSGELGIGELDRVGQLIGKLQGVMLARERQPPTVGHRLPWQPFNEITESRFSSITIENYRGINGLILDQLSGVNLIVGVNNAGKTSLLEAIELLVGQNDERVLLEAIRRRSHMEVEAHPLWLVKQLPRSVNVSGHFDQIPNNLARVAWEVGDEPGPDIEDQTSFLAHLANTSSYGGQDQSTDVVLFEDRPRRTQFQGQHCLCRSAFTSPFWASHSETLARCNKASLEAGTKPQIINFIRERIDPGLRTIELADQFNRFLVTHDGFSKAQDLATFGEGVRRVFEIGLLCAGARGGVLLIDEFENAIHTELLTVFTRLLQDLASELNVQIFLTTHSKEAIDAFILNGRQPDDIAGYAIGRTEAGVKSRRYDGSTLQRLHEAVDFDLRGVR